MSVSIIIVAYNAKQLVLNCIRSVEEKTRGIAFETIVVDNGSADGTAEAIHEAFRDVRLICKKEDRGFGKAANQGAEIARGRYLHFVNPDAFFINNAARFFLDYLEEQKNNSIAVLGAYIEDSKGIIVHSAGGFPYPARYLRARYKKVLRKLIPIKKLHSVKVSESAPQSATSVEYVTGADMFCRRDVFLAFGGFDKRFFLYFEESDLQWRMRLAGLDRLLIAGPRICHEEGHSIKFPNAKRIYLETSAQKYFSKNFGDSAGRFFRVAFVLSILLEFLVDLLRWQYTPAENLRFLKAFLRAEKEGPAGPSL